MLRVLSALAAFALPAAAQDSAFWGATGCILVPVDGEAWVAQVECANFLTNMTPADVSADLHIDGLTVHLALAQTFGRTPDTFVVTVPDGFFADPPVLVLDEEARGVIRVMQYLGF